MPAVAAVLHLTELRAQADPVVVELLNSIQIQQRRMQILAVVVVQLTAQQPQAEMVDRVWSF
jgi:hypothetical protein